jgi:hypothetical protein
VNELYEKTIEVEGRVYRYDPDRDVYYREFEPVGWDAWGWLAVILVLAAVGLYLEFWPIR